MLMSRGNSPLRVLLLAGKDDNNDVSSHLSCVQLTSGEFQALGGVKATLVSIN